ncbi:KPN_02809 family neutral zinc metallopeptidase [Nitratifractor sp.]
MRLDDERESSYVEDRRGEGPVGPGGGGISLGTAMMLWPLIRPLLRSRIGWILLAIGAFVYFSGFNPLSLTHSRSSRTVHHARDDREAVFIKKVLASTEDVWSSLLPRYGIRYRPPTLVLYRGSTRSGCGFAQAQMGPFYCPNDQKVYLDLGFFDELARRHDAPGDFAQAYVLAHEVGHHVQNLMGILRKVHALQQRALRMGDKVRANHLQIPVELQADCFAGVWAHHARQYLEPGDIEEAIRAASHIGDDTLQKQARGYVVPDSFTHGTSAQRVRWFQVGYRSGDLRSCDTFGR